MTEQTTENAATDAAMALHELVRAVEQGPYCAPEELVARARAVAFHAPALLDAAEAVQRVQALHKRNSFAPLDGFCTGCDYIYPCPTIRALDGGVPGE